MKEKKFIGVTHREAVVWGRVFFGGLAVVIGGLMLYLWSKGLLIIV